MVFYEDGEPLIDGEAGDLKVGSLTFDLVISCEYLQFTDIKQHISIAVPCPHCTAWSFQKGGQRLAHNHYNNSGN